MARKRAFDGIQDLIERTGGPKIVTTVKVNQPYAQEQHEDLHNKHSGGRGPKYLEAPLFENSDKRLGEVARRLLMRGKPRVEDTWHDQMGEPLADDVRKRAPWMFGDLANSAGVVTKVGGRNVWITPPVRERLTARELKIKDEIRNAGPGGHE